MYKTRFFIAALALVVSSASLAAASAPPVQLAAAALSNGWDIKKIAVNDNGAVVFAGGDFQGYADGLVFSAPSRFYRFATLGYEPPGTPGLVYAGFAGRYSGGLALNKAGDVVFSASLVACDQADLGACLQVHPRVNALFHYSDPQFKGDRIAMQGDPVPGRAGFTFHSFERVWVNEPGDAAFVAGVVSAGKPGEIRSGLFLYRKGSVQTVAVGGEEGIDLDSPKFALAFSEAGDLFFFTPISGRVYRFVNGALSIRLQPGVRVGLAGEVITAIHEAVPNGNGLVAFHGSFGPNPEQQGIYLLGYGNDVMRVVADGDDAPGGGKFALWVQARDRFNNLHVYPVSVPLKLGGSGDVRIAFSAPIRMGAAAEDGPATPAGLFMFNANHGTMGKVVRSGDPRPDIPSQGFGFYYSSIAFDLNDAGLVAFNPSGDGIFLALNGDVSALAARGGSTGLQDGTDYTIKEIGTFLLNGSRTVAFQASICCGAYVQGVFLAKPRTPPVPGGGFEAVTDSGLPQNWTTWWTNFGKGDVAQYNSGGHDSYDWYSVMRMHTGTGGGAVFALSDPVPVTPGTTYMLESRMRFYFDDPADRCFFTVVQLDASGAQVGESEVLGFAGDSYWTWQPMRVLLHAAPNAAFIRYRFGLISPREKYLDVDALQ
jgi:hypothetical protein